MLSKLPKLENGVITTFEIDPGSIEGKTNPVRWLMTEFVEFAQV